MSPNQPKDLPEAASASRVPFTNIPDHELIREIGRGSYGEVWLARNALGTYRAVKIVYRQTFAHDRPYEREFSGIQKFEPISRAHEGLVDILQVGRNNDAGYFYYVMELADDANAANSVAADVRRRTETEVALNGKDTADQLLTSVATYGPRTLARENNARGGVPIEECIQLGLAMTSALSYLHKQGLIHRDIKPSNIIFVNRVPKLADIGLVTDIDATRSYVGTEGFIPPEGPGTPQSDIYSLGKVLYEISTGKDRQDYPELPTKLDETASSAGLLELNEVIIKACRANPRDRYQSADKMHADLLLLHAGRSVKHVRKLERRLAVATRMGIIATTVALVAAGAFLYQQQQTTHARHLMDAEKAQRRVTELSQTLNQTDVLRAEEWFRKGDRPNALPYLARVLRRDPNHRVAAERLMAALSQHPSLRIAFRPLEHAGRVTWAQFSHDGHQILTTAADGTAWIWNASTGKREIGPLTHDREVNDAAFSLDGTMVATASSDRTARIWNAKTGEPITGALRHSNSVSTARFSPDGQWLVTTSHDRAQLWNVRTRRPLADPLRHNEYVYMAHFSPDGLFVVTASRDKTAGIWDVANGGKLLWELKHADVVFSAQFSPDSQWVVTASYDKTARVWNAKTGQPLFLSLQHDDRLASAEFSPDGQFVVTASNDQTARIWNAGTGEPIGVPLRHQGQVRSAMFSPEGLRVVTASSDGTVRLWNSRTGEPLTDPLFHGSPVYYAEFDPHGQRIVTASMGMTVLVWNTQTVPYLPQIFSRSIDDTVYSADVSRDGKSVIVASSSNAQVWDFVAGKPLGKRMRHDGDINNVQFSPDGRLAATASDDHTAVVWDAQTGESTTPPLKHRRSVVSAAFSPDGQWVVTASVDSTAQIWNAKTGHPKGQTLQHKGTVQAAQFSPDGRLVLTASHDHTAQLWDVNSGQHCAPAFEHRGPVWSANFSRDGRYVVTASDDETAQVWEVQSGHRVGPPLMHEDRVSVARFSSDGEHVVTATQSGTARVWESLTGRAVTGALRHEDKIRDVRFSPDGQWVVTASEDRTVRLWSAFSGQPVLSPLKHNGPVSATRFTTDGIFLVTVGQTSPVQVWEMPMAPLPIPLWLAELAEALASQRFNSRGLLEKVPAEEVLKFSHRLSGDSAGDYYSRWRQWFFAGDSKRTISPSSKVTVAEYGQRRIEENTVKSLEEAIRLCPTGGLAQARLALEVLHQDKKRNPQQVGVAEYWSRRATELAPNEPQVWRTRAKVLLRNAEIKPAESPKPIVWDFNTQGDYEGWTNFARINNTEVRDGCLSFDISGADPHFAVSLPKLWGSYLSRLRVHLRNQTAGNTAQLFWTTVAKPTLHDSRYCNFLIRSNDSDFATYTVNLSTHPGWTNQTIIALRLDPVDNAATGHVAIDWISLDDAGLANRSDAVVKGTSKLDEGLAATHHALELQPDDPETLVLEGDLLERANRLEEALRTYSSGAQAAGSHAGLEAMRSRALLKHSKLSARLSRPIDAQADFLLAKNIPARDPAARPNFVDLSSYYNASLDENWHNRIVNGNPLPTLPRGVQRFGRTDFDVRGVAQVTSKRLRAVSPEYPEVIPDIALNQYCARLHFLHAAGFTAAATNGTVIGKYIVHFANRHQYEIPIALGVNLHEWSQQLDPVAPREGIIWRGTNWHTNVRLYKCTWENPLANVQVASIDLVSTMTDVAPFLIAITAE